MLNYAAVRSLLVVVTDVHHIHVYTNILILKMISMVSIRFITREKENFTSDSEPTNHPKLLGVRGKAVTQSQSWMFQSPNPGCHDVFLSFYLSVIIRSWVLTKLPIFPGPKLPDQKCKISINRAMATFSRFTTATSWFLLRGAPHRLPSLPLVFCHGPGCRRARRRRRGAIILKETGKPTPITPVNPPLIICSLATSALCRVIYLFSLRWWYGQRCCMFLLCYGWHQLIQRPRVLISSSK